MAGNEKDMRRMRHGRLAAAAGAAIAVATLGLAGSAAASPGVLPAAYRAGINLAWQAAGRPAGGSGPEASWAPVPYRDAQLSVPGSWLVETPQPVGCGGGAYGMIFAGARPEISEGAGCGLPASLAWIVPAGHIPPGIRHRKPTAVIHGIPVYRLHSAKGSVLYLVPELKVRVGARGPIARRVLATLTRSPLSVVLGRGRPGPGRVPASWAWRRFGGIRFAAPRAWTRQRRDQWATCGTELAPGTLLLINATKPPLYLPCPGRFATAANEQAQPGLTVVTGKYAAKSVGERYARCQVRHGVRICLASVTGQGGGYSGVLIFSVSQPHQHAATFVLLGLPGPGTCARTIFGSIRLTPHRESRS